MLSLSAGFAASGLVKILKLPPLSSPALLSDVDVNTSIFANSLDCVLAPLLLFALFWFMNCIAPTL